MNNVCKGPKTRQQQKFVQRDRLKKHVSFFVLYFFFIVNCDCTWRVREGECECSL